MNNGRIDLRNVPGELEVLAFGHNIFSARLRVSQERLRLAVIEKDRQEIAGALGLFWIFSNAHLFVGRTQVPAAVLAIAACLLGRRRRLGNSMSTKLRHEAD